LTCCAADRRSRPGIAGAALLVLAALVLSIAVGAEAARRRGEPPLELINPRLGPDYSQWLVGPIARLAKPDEIDAYLALADDAAAAAFIQKFWAERDPAPDRADNPLRDAFDKRAAEADKQFTEGGYLGRRTARGTTYVLFGPPTKIDHDISPDPDGPPLEVWRYDSKVTAGLDGERPAKVYRFIRQGDLTVVYVPKDLHGDRTRIEEF
jgi:GWxTD domain-containing protein